MERIELYRCLTCGTIHTESSIHRHRKETNHEWAALSDEESRERNFLPEASFKTTSEGVEADPAYLTKRVVYIGKNGKEIATRRNGSRVEIQYGYNNPITHENIVLTPLQFYQILSKAGDVDPARLRTCSSKASDGIMQYGKIRSMLAQLQARSSYVVALYYDKQLMLFPFSNGKMFSHYLEHPVRVCVGQRHHHSISEVMHDSFYDSYQDRDSDECHYDLLMPRNGTDTVILATYELFFTNKEPLIHKFLFFETTYDEFQAITDDGEAGCPDITAKAREVLIQ